MNKVDMFFDGREIWDDCGKYYIVRDGEFISPPFTSLKEAQNNAWKYETPALHADFDKTLTGSLGIEADAPLKIEPKAEITFIVCTFLESEISDEVLKYVDRFGRPDKIEYCEMGNHYYAKITYNERI